jgi:hypothetical protein
MTYTPPGAKPSLKDVIRAHINQALIRLRVAQPGRVDSYDDSSGTVDVTPLIRVPQTNPDGSVTWLDLPKLPRVPVHYPVAGGRRIKLPISQGDIVLLIWCDFSIDDWQAGAGQADPKNYGFVTPTYRDGHRLADAIAIPGLLDPNSSTRPTYHDDITIGSDGTVYIGEGADASILRGEDTKMAYDLHTHQFVGVPPGVTSTTLMPMSPLPAGSLATKGKVK